MLIYVDLPRRAKKIAERARSPRASEDCFSIFIFIFHRYNILIVVTRFLLAPAHADALGNSRSLAIDPRSMLMHTGSNVRKRSSSSILINGFRDRVREPSASIPSAQSVEQELSSESLLKSHLHFLI